VHHPEAAVKPTKKRRVFSKEEADALVPELEKRLRNLREKKESYSRTHDSLFMHELVCAAERSNGLPEERDDLEAGIHALEEAIEELAKDIEGIFAIGCFLRDIETGYVEFLGLYDGQEVYFSWRLGEPGVAHYRLMNGKRHDRIPLSGEKTANKKSK